MRAQLCAISGLLAVGHDKGEVRLYRFSQQGATVGSVTLTVPMEAAPTAEDEARHQPPGFHLLLVAKLHSAPVQALSMCSAAGLLAVGDSSGSLSVLDLEQVSPALPACACACAHAYACGVFGGVARREGAGGENGGGEER